MFHLLKLENTPILDQLKLEEALLRADERNWCIVNTGSSPAIVMGISGKPEELLYTERVHTAEIEVIKRFSGGGTVFVDAQTVFVTFICNRSTFNLPLQPKPILNWTEQFYKPLFPQFQVRENDYVFGELKFGGNAQYIQRERWLHHTSFLWDYSTDNMHYLRLPNKRPEYRKDREHTEFLCTLKALFPEKQNLIDQLIEHMQNTLNAQLMPFNQVEKLLLKPHRKTTTNILLP